MAIQIGQPALPTFNEPLALLKDCHRRIEHFLGVLLLVANQASEGPLSTSQREALKTALRYFQEGAPKHTQDEEVSLFPRLRSRACGQHQTVEAILQKMDELESDHRRAEVAHAEVDKICRRWLAENHLPSTEAQKLISLLNELQQTYSRNIRLEDEEVFPTAGQLLAPETLKTIGSEMAARRGRKVWS